MTFTSLHSRTASPPLPFALILAGAGVALLNLPGPNAPITSVCMIVLLAGAALLWRPGEPPILLFVFGYQWLQASISAFHSNWLDIDVGDYSLYGGKNKLAIFLTLLGLLALAAGMRLGAGPSIARYGESARRTALSQPVERWFKLYIQSSAVAFAALFAAALAPGLSQPLLALASLKWAFFFMFAYASFVRGAAGNIFFVGAFLFELIVSIGGYFSDFKTVMYFTLFAMLMAGVRMRARLFVGVVLLTGLIVASGVVWTAVKEQYRDFASGGTEAQVVVVDVGARLSMLALLVGNLDANAIDAAVDNMIRRISYVELFGVVLVRVPEFVPHENGAVLLDAVSRPFMPRILFSDKSEIDDTLRTNFYTGGISGTYRGTSISLGYMTDTYIDFGAYFMVPMIALIGYIYGRIYRALLEWKKSHGLLGFAVASSIMAQTALLEVSLPKLVGGVTASILIAAIFVSIVVPRWSPWVVDGNAG